jgi:hypothetical protein
MLSYTGSTYVGLSRRHDTGDRRTFDTEPVNDRRGADRRRHGTDNYFVVLGDGGINQFNLLVGFPIACLIALALIRSFAS